MLKFVFYIDSIIRVPFSVSFGVRLVRGFF